MTFLLPQIKSGEILRLEDNYPLALSKSQERYFVFRDECTHAACAFSQDGEVIDATLICNCHGAEFDLLTGAVLQGPAEEPLKIFPVQGAENRLEVIL
jgi:3-phenylpropionate/trans-cinnamate dioxygenase ferredoxin component